MSDDGHFNNLKVDGNVGIGTTTPHSNLHVRVDTNQNALFVSNGNGGDTGACGIAFVNDANTAYVPVDMLSSRFAFTQGNVGIGTQDPKGNLHVRLETNQNIVFVPNGNGGDTGACGIAFINDANTAYVPVDMLSSRFAFTQGNVGIGTQDPKGNLHVRLETNQNIVFIPNGNGADTGACGIAFINDADTVYVPVNMLASRFVFTQGNVGIGYSNPAYAFDVGGPGAKSSYSRLGGMSILTADTGYEWWTGGFTDGTSWQLVHRKMDGSWKPQETVTATTAGNVGLGYTTPNYALDVGGPGAKSSYSRLGGMSILTADSGYEWWMGAFTDGQSWNLIHRKMDDAGSWTPAQSVTVTTAGNVGIGSVTPDVKLRVEGDATVNGTLRVTSDVILTGADCAEDFDIAADQIVEPGSVMIIDENGALLPAGREYDQRVVGVISGAGDLKPALTLDRQAGPNRLPLALVGKVNCKVDAAYGAIKVGDLLTTSPTLGHAMKVTDPGKAFGAVIGKALRAFQNGQGLIPILVTRQ